MKKEDLESAMISVSEKIRTRLLSMLSKQKPEGYLLFNKAIKIEFTENSENPKVGESYGRSMSFNVKGVATGYLFKKESLSKALAESNAGKFTVRSPKNDIVSVENMESLDFDLISTNSQNKEVVINLKGKAEFMWMIDTVKLLRDISSYKGKDYNSVFQNYPSIEKANISRSPSWWKKIPKDPSKIKLIIETETENVSKEENQ